MVSAAIYHSMLKIEGLTSGSFLDHNTQQAVYVLVLQNLDFQLRPAAVA
jgi:hypothetical protein